MTEVTANTAAVTPSTAADIHVRPPLPEGIRYFMEGNDRLTITDVSGAPAQAYIGDFECADARCLVWPDKMIYYPKYYGDYRRLEAALEDAGYKRATEDAFVGARIQRIPHGHAFVAPYLDVCGYVQDRGEFLTIEYGGIPCRETEGLTRYRGRSCVYNGSTGHAEEDMTYVDNWGWVSEDAYDDHFGRCVITDEHFHRDRLTLANDGDAFISDQVISRGRSSDQ